MLKTASAILSNLLQEAGMKQWLPILIVTPSTEGSQLSPSSCAGTAIDLAL
jgi:hypothetical protein